MGKTPKMMRTDTAKGQVWLDSRSKDECFDRTPRNERWAQVRPYKTHSRFFSSSHEKLLKDIFKQGIDKV